MNPEAIDLFNRQRALLLRPDVGLSQDIEEIYINGRYEVGWPRGAEMLFSALARDNTAAIVGVALGDEGKGRITDNRIEGMLAYLDKVYAVRFQGGNNAGHSVERKGTKLALHLVPSGVMHEKVIGIMDQGMVIHPDLRDEVVYIEEAVGDVRDKLFLSADAILATDLERAEELLNRKKQGKAAGGTGRGIGPAYAHHYDRLGFHIHDLLNDEWRGQFAERYDQLDVEFKSFGLEMKDTEVPDFEKTKRDGKAQIRKLGSREEYLDRLDHFRSWLIERDMVKNIVLMHRNIIEDMKAGVIFEGAQALGLHAWLGTRPDVTSSDTSVYGVLSGTGFWRPADIAEKTGVFKLTYTSSVGARKMPTQILLPKDVRGPQDLTQEASEEEKRGAYIREEAHEFGTTTGRPRDILHLDLEMMRYNCRMSGVEVLAGTHLDIAREDEDIWVCTHYTDEDGKVIYYQPGLRHLEKVVPHYVKLPGWDGEKVRKAASFDELPENAVKFLAFIQKRVGYPIVVATTGPDRSNYIEIPEYPSQGTIYSSGN